MIWLHVILIISLWFRAKNYPAGSGLLSPHADWSQHLAWPPCTQVQCYSLIINRIALRLHQAPFMQNLCQKTPNSNLMSILMHSSFFYYFHFFSHFCNKCQQSILENTCLVFTPAKSLTCTCFLNRWIHFLIRISGFISLPHLLTALVSIHSETWATLTARSSVHCLQAGRSGTRPRAASILLTTIIVQPSLQTRDFLRTCISSSSKHSPRQETSFHCLFCSCRIMCVCFYNISRLYWPSPHRVEPEVIDIKCFLNFCLFALIKNQSCFFTEVSWGDKKLGLFYLLTIILFSVLLLNCIYFVNPILLVYNRIQSSGTDSFFYRFCHTSPSPNGSRVPTDSQNTNIR